MKLLLEKAVRQFESRLPFVLYKKPNQSIVTGFFQKNDILFLADDFNESGFVFASFDGSQTVLIPESESEIFTAKVDKDIFKTVLNDVGISDELHRNDFEKLVSKGIQAIDENQFQKVVLSRKEIIELSHFDLTAFFQNLIQLYPTAFGYCFFHPTIGIWYGASPEQLIQSEGIFFRTIALAGTQKNVDSEEIKWKEKEINEQQFVTDYIVSKLKNVSENLEVSKPYNFRAGLLWHIKTDISGKLIKDFELQNIIRLLHPTPAVCGFPKENSKAFILDNENYNRTFYTGFLGELNLGSNKSDLYVNLRCMEISISMSENNTKQGVIKAILYMGCGITTDSNPEKEWQESVHKSLTMKRVLVSKLRE